MFVTYLKQSRSLILNNNWKYIFFGSGYILHTVNQKLWPISWIILPQRNSRYFFKLQTQRMMYEYLYFAGRAEIKYLTFTMNWVNKFTVLSIKRESLLKRGRIFMNNNSVFLMYWHIFLEKIQTRKLEVLWLSILIIYRLYRMQKVI